LVYPALHLYIYSALHRLFPAASAYDVAGFVPNDKSDLEDGRTNMGGKGSLRQLQALWAGVYLMTLVLVAWIYRGVIASVEARAAAAGKKEKKDGGHLETSTPNPERSLANLIFGSSPPLQAFLLLLPLSKRLHSIYMLRLFNDPLAMIVFYFAVLLLCKKQWYIGVAVYS
jgi:alpha-1,3-mannosyltransferase